MKQKKLKIMSIKFIAIVCIVMLLNILIIPKQELAASYTQTVKSGINNFPVEYRAILENLKKSYPNATFEAYYTGISWDELIEKETSVHTRNTVINSSDSSWKCSCGKVVSGYACASKEIIEYYIDPRNFLNDVNIFQFLDISYNEKVHNLAGVKSSVKNTFLDANVTFTRYGQTKTMSYAEIILDAAKKSNMSPYSITTKIIQEVGSKGSSSVSGKYSGYEGYYNFFNYGAYDSGNPIVNALEYAKKNNWNNQYDAIVEGAELLANSYTNAGQNTAYFYKWDVVGRSILKTGCSQTVSTSDMFSHQYMTNIQDPVNQSRRLYNTYAQNNLLDKPLNFIIPIYEAESGANKLPSSIDTSNKNAYYVNETDGINVRQGPSTSSNKLTAISKDTIVIVLQRKCANSDGYSWDKIQLSNGVEGYVVSNYLTACNDNKNENEKTKEETKVVGKAVTTDSLRLRNEASTSGIKLATIPKGTEVEIIQKNVANDGTNIWYKVIYNGTQGYVSSLYLKEISGNSSNNEKICKLEEKTITITPGATINKIQEQYKDAKGDIKTGGKITVNGKSYEVVVKGDVDGDGKVTAVDALKVLKKSANTYNLTGAYSLAGDIDGDGKITAIDALKTLKNSAGTYKISL